MAEQYLNKEGVKTLWTAVKGKISTAQTTVENEFVNGTKKAKYAQQADNIGGVSLGGLVQSIKVGSTTYSPTNSVITLGDYSLTTHTHTFASITSKPTTLSGYGITDAYTQSQANAKFQAKGSYATLDSNGKVPSTQLPSYVDDVIEGYYSNGKFYSDSAKTKEITGEGGKIYTDLTSNKTYRWGGTAWVEISASLALGETEGTAYDGAKGALALNEASAAFEKARKNEEDIVNFSKNKADKATTLAGYGITDAYTKTEADGKYAGKSTTLAGYGITDAYTKTETDGKYVALSGDQIIDGQKLFFGIFGVGNPNGNYGSLLTDAVNDVPRFVWAIETSRSVRNKLNLPTSFVTAGSSNVELTIATIDQLPTAISTTDLNAILV